MRNIILLTGLAGSGKTTIAKHFEREYLYTRVRFADPLKAMLAAFGLTPDEIDGRLRSVPCDLLCGKTPRIAMQTLGTEWGRQLIHDKLWTRHWQHRVMRLMPEVDVVVDDCRFPNEIVAAREVGRTTVIRLERDGAMAKGGIAGHASEQELPFDFEIENNGTVLETIFSINKALNSWRAAA